MTCRTMRIANFNIKRATCKDRIYLPRLTLLIRSWSPNIWAETVAKYTDYIHAYRGVSKGRLNRNQWNCAHLALDRSLMMKTLHLRSMQSHVDKSTAMAILHVLSLSVFEALKSPTAQVVNFGLKPFCLQYQTALIM